ncbi:hypothetical protein HYFRA_00002400 [Hymenoscyphus fraxineus]|uniref:PH domain-containing protein n=1 Tax=Hymenoscyphus fraxineus TaxID=746836 RepID=A0A9N9PZB3_9HELO|nr:hypothetical protein HYFRA_00002400 [Hymenoscyphus fraxineus]
MAKADLENLAFRDTDPSHSLNPPVSAISFNRRARPPPMDLTTPDGVDRRIPLAEKKVHRRASKGGLRGMFTRTKAQMEKGVVSPVLEEPISSISSSFHHKDDRTKVSVEKSTTTSSPPTPVTPATPASRLARPSRMNFKSKSMKPKHQAPKSSPKSANSSPSPRRSSAAWDPPPLFQAYPQAVKHATLSASTLSADAILRLNGHSRKPSLREDIGQLFEEGGNLDQSSTAIKKEKAKSKHRRQISGSMSKAEWTQKIFVLVTSGYLLQYAGDGSSDRLPEKMMQLGKDSVAFASDAIPGKHWVLQISQALDSDGAPAADSRSLLSRLAFRGADHRRAATSLLLVMDSAEDMDSWLAVVRREIESLGGKKHVSETGKSKPDDKVMQFKAQPSHRYLVQRSSDGSDPTSPTSPTRNDGPREDIYEEIHSDLMKPQNSRFQGSIADAVTAREGQFEFSKERTNRFSVVSSGQRTLFTSHSSSPSTSPTRESCSTLDDFSPSVTPIEDARPRPKSSAANERRRSMQTMAVPDLDVNALGQYRPHSTYGGPGRPSTVSKFSVPNSSVKRFSAIKSPALHHPATDVPAPPKVTTTPLERKDKALPSIPLETSQYTSRLATTTLIFQSSPENSPRLKPSFVESYGRSSIHSGRRSILVPPKSSSKDTFMEFQFPRRYSSVQLLRDTSEGSRDYMSSNAKATPLSPPPLSPPHIADMVKSNYLTVEKEGAYIVSSHAQGKLRRPKSMQARTGESSMYSSHKLGQVSLQPRIISDDLHTTNALKTLSSESILRSRHTSLRLPSPPSTQRNRTRERRLTGRQSLPVMITGPPPAPPPRCALPALPSPQDATMSRSSTPQFRHRNSVAS